LGQILKKNTGNVLDALGANMHHQTVAVNSFIPQREKKYT
jgi:hypothetical protein